MSIEYEPVTKDLIDGQDYVAEIASITISGNAGAKDVTMKYSVNGFLKEIKSSDDGSYVIQVPYNWTGIVEPYNLRYFFTPKIKAYFGDIQSGQIGVKADQINENYTTVLKPPLILVHGWLGLPGAQSSSCDEKIQSYTEKPDNSTLGPIAKWFSQDYDVWIAHLDSGVLSTPLIERNASCLINQIETVYTENPHKINIVAHSMGGLVLSLIHI